LINSIMKTSNLLVILICLNCINSLLATSYSFAIDYKLISDKGIIHESRKSGTLLIKNAGQVSRKDISLNQDSPRLIDYRATEPCNNCYFLATFKDSKEDKTFYSNIPYRLLANVAFNDFIEVGFDLDNDISSITYGIKNYIKEGESQNPTEIRESDIDSAMDSPNLLQETLAIQHTKEAFSATKDKEPEEEQTFYKKYFWYLVIGGFIAFQFFTFDKEKLNGAMNPAPAPR